MTYIDIHVLQTVPPSNLNRDDTGSPKTAVYGGVRRARVSSQAWKRATRNYFNDSLDPSDVGFRTKRVVELISRALVSRGIEKDEADKLADKAVSQLGLKLTAPKVSARSKKAEVEEPEPLRQPDYLVFISAGQVANLADLVVAAKQEGREVSKKEAALAFNRNQSVDVALFGRMVADDAVLNVDAAVQVAHAISVHAVDNEFDYFTAVDDLQLKDNITGAGMIGTVEYNSSTLYRYATINLDMLRENLGDVAATAKAAEVFVEAFVRSMPTGKQNTFANRTLPEAVVVVVRDDQPVNLVGAFEKPVAARADVSVVTSAASAIESYSAEIGAAYGSPSETWVVGVSGATAQLESFGPAIPLSELVSNVGELAARRLEVSA